MLYIWLENSLANKINLLIRKKVHCTVKKVSWSFLWQTNNHRSMVTW